MNKEDKRTVVGFVFLLTLIVMILLVMWLSVINENDIKILEGRVEMLEKQSKAPITEFQLTWPQTIMKKGGTEYIMWEPGGEISKYKIGEVKRSSLWKG